MALEHKTGILPRKAGKGYVSGMMVFEFFSTGMPAIAASAGADFLMYDMEHTGIGFETLKDQMAACRGWILPRLFGCRPQKGTRLARCWILARMG